MSGALRRESRERSGLAYGAGFAGVLYLFRYSLAPLALSHAGAVSELATWLFLLLGLCAPLAIALAFAAGAALDRSPGKSGALPALFGLTVGMWGTAAWLFLRGHAWEYVAYPP